MPKYVVNIDAQKNGDHEVHKSGCKFFPSKRRHLGDHDSCKTAVLAAKKFFKRSNGCYFCARKCHTT